MGQRREGFLADRVTERPSDNLLPGERCCCCRARAGPSAVLEDGPRWLRPANGLGSQGMRGNLLGQCAGEHQLMVVTDPCLLSF